VVEDDPRAVELIGAVLRPEGYRVVSASDGEEGLALIRRERPGLVILDLLMPETDGFTVLERLRADPATTDIPVIVFTAKTLTKEEAARLQGRVSHLAQKGEFSWPGFAHLVRTYYQPRVA